MSNKVKSLCFIAIVIAFILLFSPRVMAGASGVYDGDLTYYEEDGKITIEDCNEYAESIIIPNKIDGYPVTTIRDNAFYNCSSLKSITIPNTVTHIGGSAFGNCSSLTSISLPDSITNFDYIDSMFAGCSNLKNVKFPSKLPEIPDGMFRDCTSLEKITIPSSVKKIKGTAFQGCTSLKAVTIPSSVTEIKGYNTFENCTSLQSITIPDSVTEIGPYMFYRCAGLTNVTLPAYITKIPGDCFSGCKSLKSIKLPSYIKEIGGYAFYECEKLTSINIPNNVNYIGGVAFYGCKSLTTLKLPNNLTEISSCMLQDCTSLKTLYVPKKVTSASSYAFEGDNIQNITFYGYSGTWAKSFANEKGAKFVSLTPTTSVKINKTQVMVATGNTEQLTATIVPSNSNYKAVAWESNKEDVAIVSGEGVIKALKTGKAEITVTTADGKTAKCSVTIFKDVKKGSWYYNAVKYVYDNNIISGYNDTTFAPNDKLTRGMMVTILYRMEGSPKVTGTPKFSDVKDSSKYYYKAVKWATDKGIVSGYSNGKFGPNDNIQRQQLAVILNKYAQYKGKKTTQTNDLKEFTDTKQISSYAINQMRWAVGAGVINGNVDKKTGKKTLNPKGNATRAEVAAMMEKYCKNVGR